LYVSRVGATGSGKTSIAKRAIELALKHKIKVTVIDWKGEYAQTFKGATIIRKLNFWDIPGNNNQEKALIAVEMLREITRDMFDVSGAATTLLLKELINIYREEVPTTSRVIEALEVASASFSSQRRMAEYNMAQALIRRLLWLKVDEERKAINVRGADTIIIYDLSSLPSVYLKTMYSLYILLLEYKRATNISTEFKTLIVADEAENYIRPRRTDEPPSLGERLVNEIRSFGIGCIIIAPDPEQLPQHLPKDVAAVISLGYQGLPRTVLELINIHRYKDINYLLRKMKKPMAFIYHNGTLKTRRLPKPYKKTIDLGVEPIPEESAKAEESQPEAPNGFPRVSFGAEA